MLPPAATPPRLLTLILLNALSVAALNLFLPSLPAIAAEFDADYALVNLSIAGYAATTAVLQLVTGPLSDRFGRRPVILGGLAIFVLASLGCLAAESIEAFLLGRMLQAAVISGYAVSLAVVRDTAPAEKTASLLGHLATAWALAPMLAPMAGGALETLFGWRGSFWAFAVLGAGVLVLCWFDLGETNRSPSATFARQFRLYPALLRSGHFWGYALCMTFSTGAFYVFLGGAPLVAAGAFAMPPALLGIAMGSMTAGFICGSFLAGRVAARHALTTTVIAGRLVAATGLAAGLLLLAAGVVHEATFFGACVLAGIGNGLTLPGSSAGAMSVKPALAGSAAGLSGALTVAGGAAMAGLAGAVLTPANAALGVLALMLLSMLLALVAALAVRRLERKQGLTARPL